MQIAALEKARLHPAHCDANLEGEDDASPEEILIELSRRLTQSLTHSPSKLMRKAAREGDSELLNFVVSGLKDTHRGR